jgi:hypothetical protein
LIAVDLGELESLAQIISPIRDLKKKRGSDRGDFLQQDYFLGICLFPRFKQFEITFLIRGMDHNNCICFLFLHLQSID